MSHRMRQENECTPPLLTPGRGIPHSNPCHRISLCLRIFTRIPYQSVLSAFLSTPFFIRITSAASFWYFRENVGNILKMKGGDERNVITSVMVRVKFDELCILKIFSFSFGVSYKKTFIATVVALCFAFSVRYTIYFL